MLYVIESRDAKALASLAKLTSKSASRPALECIHIVVNGNRLRAYATDSYRLARLELHKSASIAEDGEITVNAAALAAALKGAKLARLETFADHGDTKLNVKTGSGVDAVLRHEPYPYPDCERLLEHNKELPEVGNVNPSYLADVCAVVKSAIGPKASTRIETHYASAWHISAGDIKRCAFLDAMLMPVRA